MVKIRQLLMSTSRLLFVLFLLLSVFGFAIFHGGLVSWTIFYTVTPFLLYSIGLLFYPLTTLTGEREIQKYALQNGEKLNVRLIVSRKFRFPILYTIIEEKWQNDTLSKKTGKMKKIGVLGFRKSLAWDYEIESMPRGEHVIEGVTIEVTDFFGWINKKRFIPVKDTVLVYPKMKEIPYFPTGAQDDHGSMITPYRIAKEATLATGVRDYQPGDRVSSIHWKSFARTQTLMTKEFEDSGSQDLLLVFDKRPADLFEEQVAFAASILQDASNEQVGIGFLATGLERVFFPPAESKAQFQKILISLVKMTMDESIASSANFRGVFDRGGRILIVTGNPDWAFLAPIVVNVEDARAIICFVIAGKEVSPSGKLAADIQFAKSKGITVHTFVTASRGRLIHE